MAFGFGEKREPSSGSDTQLPSYDDAANIRVEEGGKSALSKRGRIDRPVEEAKEPDMTLAGQMEAEEGNAIQYRTCSWQMVRCINPNDYTAY